MTDEHRRGRSRRGAAEAGQVNRRRRSGYGRYAGSKVLGALGSLMFMLVVNFFLFRVLPGDPARTLGRVGSARRSSSRSSGDLRPRPGARRAVPDVPEEHRPRRPRLLDPLPPGRVDDPGRAALADDAAGRYVDRAGRAVRGLDRDPGRLGPRLAASTGSRPARSLTLYSMPEWWLGLLLIAAFAVGIGPLPGIFPTGGLHSVDVGPVVAVEGVLDTLWHLALPVITLTLAYLADYALIMRGSLVDELRLGLPDHRAGQGAARRRRSATGTPCRNALLPTTTVVALNFGFVVAGAITDRDDLLDPRPRAADDRRAAGAGLLAAAGHLPARRRPA